MHITIQLNENTTTLNLLLNKDLSKREIPFGWFEVEEGDKTLATWDNLQWEGLDNKKVFKKEMKKELGEKWKQVFEDARFLLKKAKKLDLL
jgi:antitoxin component of RelBE/YafQ-DinJ toxin-antitoxin module